MAEEKDGIEEVQEIDIVPSSDYEYLMSAVNAYECVDQVSVLTKEDKKVVDRVKRRCLRIIDYIIGNMSEELFEDESDQ